MNKLKDCTVFDLAALISLVTCACLVGLGIDGEVKGVFVVASGWFLGRGYSVNKK
jgi:hypothetical protein